MTVTKPAETLTFGNLVTTATRVFSLQTVQRYSLQVVIDENTPSAVVFASATDVDITANTFAETAHGYTTGLKGQFTTSSALPAGLVALTDYFAVVVDANTLKFADTLAHALVGTTLDITTTGTGNQTFTPTALAGGAIKLQKSNISDVLDSAYTYASGDWTDLAAATAVAADATFWANVNEPDYLAACLHITLTAGRLAPVAHWVSRRRNAT